MEESKELSNLEFPISSVIREALKVLTKEERAEILEGMTSDEFISHRVDIYLQEIETAMHNGFDELGAKEIALKECLAGIIEDNG